MSDLLWVRGNGRLTSEANGLQLIVTVSSAGGYRFQLMCDATSSGIKACVGSGQRDHLGDAMEAAERAAHRFAAQPHAERPSFQPRSGH